MMVIDASVLANAVGDDEQTGRQARELLREHRELGRPDATRAGYRRRLRRLPSPHASRTVCSGSQYGNIPLRGSGLTCQVLFVEFTDPGCELVVVGRQRGNGPVRKCAHGSPSR